MINFKKLSLFALASTSLSIGACFASGKPPAEEAPKPVVKAAPKVATKTAPPKKTVPAKVAKEAVQAAGVVVGAVDEIIAEGKEGVEGAFEKGKKKGRKAIKKL